MRAAQDPSNAEGLRIAALNLIVTQAHKRQALSPICAALVSIAIWPVGDHFRELVWVGLLTAISLWRHLFAVAFLRAAQVERSRKHWEWHFFFSFLVACSVWGIGAWLVMPADSLAHQALVYTFTIGMVGGASVLYGVHRLSATLALPIIFLPSAIYLCSFGETFQLILASGGFLLMLAANRGSQLMIESMRRTIELTRELDHQAHIDALSGLSNRRAFAETGERMCNSNDSVALLMIDIDHFKAINDRYGHGAGDRVIVAMGELLATMAQPHQCAARVGGEEFALLLPGVDLIESESAARRLLEQVRRLRIEHQGIALQCSVSIGYALSRTAADDRFSQLLIQSDRALYAAKRAGRDRALAFAAEMDASGATSAIARKQQRG